jgi:hypothetical protein
MMFSPLNWVRTTRATEGSRTTVVMNQWLKPVPNKKEEINEPTAIFERIHSPHWMNIRADGAA